MRARVTDYSNRSQARARAACKCLGAVNNCRGHGVFIAYAYLRTENLIIFLRKTLISM